MSDVRMFSETASRLSLLLYIIALPLFEAPKHIFAVCFIVFSLFCYGRAIFCWRHFWIVPIISSSFLAGLFSDWYSLQNILAWVSPVLVCLAIAINRSLVSFHRNILLALVFSCLIAIHESFYQWLSPGWIVEYPNFRSVGHVNQSALYLVLIMPISWSLLELEDYWPTNWNLFLRVLVGAFLLSGFFFLIVSRSMVAWIGFGLAFILAVHRGRTALSTVLVALVLGVMCLLVASISQIGLANFSVTENLTKFSQEVMTKFDWQTKDGFGRLGLFYSGVIVWLDSWMFGSGIGSFRDVVNPTNVQQLIQDLSISQFADGVRLTYSSHGHSLYTTMLTERGVFGFAAVLGPICFWWFRFARLVWYDKNRACFTVYLAFVALTQVLILGLAQTTLHVEHGHVAFILVGIAIANYDLESGATV